MAVGGVQVVVRVIALAVGEDDEVVDDLIQVDYSEHPHLMEYCHCAADGESSFGLVVP